MTSADASTYETLGELAAYQVMWSFGQKVSLLSLVSLGTIDGDLQAARRLRCGLYRETLRTLRAERQFPFPPEMPPDAAAVAGRAFHKTFDHLEKEFWRNVNELLPELALEK